MSSKVEATNATNEKNEELSPKFIWTVVAITIVLNLIICSVIYLVLTKEYVIQFKSESQVMFEVKAASGAVLDDTIQSTSAKKPGYVFEGWFLDNGTFVHKYEVPTTMPSKNVTVYGKWTKEQYTITFDANGGSFAPGAKTSIDLEYEEVIYDNISSIGIPRLDGKTFLGWGRNDTSTSPITNDKNKLANLVPARDITLYAIWGD